MGTHFVRGEKVATTTADILAERVEKLKDLIPEAFTENKVDWEKLQMALGEFISDSPERYSLTWVGKRDAIRLLQSVSRATLSAAPEESVNFEDSGNLFIEGDNLEALKLLYKPYFGRIKMVYIDPPYNTGKDFIYPDNFIDPLDTYLRLTEQKDDEGNLLTSNPETGGRYHSSWLSMMYPRLFMARQLLREDGVIFVSIDYHEAYNLRALMNEVFGPENFIAELVWEKTRKNDAKLFSVGHDYMIVFARSLSTLKENKTVWREAKPGAKEIMEEYRRLRAIFGGDDKAIETELRAWYQSLPEGNASKKLSRYKWVDKWGPWRDRDISWPGGGGPRYDVIHPLTQQPCKVPERGWGFASPEAMQRQIDLGLVVFRDDHTQPPYRKAHLVPVPDELDEDEDLFDDEADDGDDNNDEAVGMQVMPSVIYKQAQVSVKYLRNLMGNTKLFNNPKDHEVLARLIRYVSAPSGGDIVLDFFAGSCSTAEAVLRLNREDGGNRRFICVQLPEPTPEKSEARKAGYRTIAELGKARIKRVIEDMSQAGQQTNPQEDLGFRVFKLSESNYKQWQGVTGQSAEAYVGQMEFVLDPLRDGWKLQDVVWEVAIKEGFGLGSTLAKLGDVHTNNVWKVSDHARGQSFLITFDDNLDPSTVKTLSLAKGDLFICRDVALTDSLAANLRLQCKLKTI